MSYGSNFRTFSAVYSYNEWGFLQWGTCEAGNLFPARLTVSAGETYYIQAGIWYPDSQGILTLEIGFQPAPPNDDFANAQPVGALPFSYSSSNQAATSESGEPRPSCAYNEALNTVWFAFTPNESRSVSARLSNVYFSTYLAVYTGDAVTNLAEERCADYAQYNPLAFNAEAGKTYYFQLGSQYYGEGGEYTFELDYTPPPIASFWYWSSDASIYDMVTFYSSSYDPISGGFSDFWWAFGDGTTATGNPATHQYAADGDYSVWHKVQTPDMRTAETSQVVQVRTHDVGIGKFSVPQSAKAGQTRSVSVGISNTRYPEAVEVVLYKSVPGGYGFVGQLLQTVLVRPANRTTEFSFNYTFTAEDAAMGKVTFMAIAYLQGYRDALPGDNEVNASPTKVAR